VQNNSPSAGGLLAQSIKFPQSLQRTNPIKHHSNQVAEQLCNSALALAAGMTRAQVNRQGAVSLGPFEIPLAKYFCGQRSQVALVICLPK
jgi:hypothetical protein